MFTKRNIGIMVVVGVVVLLQLFSIPTLQQQTNPPVVQEPAWDSPQTRQLAQRACFDCHSNETQWPWYSKVAPVSWLITRDTIEGREHVNFSDWGRYSEEAEEFAEVIREGEMPLPIYLPLHPEARLSAAEQQQLIDGLVATVGQSQGSEQGEEHEEEEHEEEEYE
jgi:hypothetical protein